MRRAALVVTILLASGARAHASPEIYEDDQLERALGERVRDLAPQGKRIVFVELTRAEVFVEDDLVLPVVLPASNPTWPNTFHWLTEEHVIRRELLFREGQLYDHERVEESERNLRNLGIFSLVRIVAVRTNDPSTVGVLVFTRDLWSLRAETAFQGTGTAFSGDFQLVERNLFGRQKELAARFSIDPYTYTIGEAFSDYRLLEQELSLGQSLGVILNRETGGSEGSYGDVSIGRPFYDLVQEWSWGLSASYQVSVFRRSRGGKLLTYPVIDGVVFNPDPDAPCDPAGPDCVTRVYDSRSVGVDGSVTYRRGTRYKQAFRLGAHFGDGSVEAAEESGVSDEEVEAFEAQLLPIVQRQVYPYVGYELFIPEYVDYENFSTYGRAEPVRLGAHLASTFTFPLRAFGSETNAVTFADSIGYALGDGRYFARADLSTSARLEEYGVGYQALTTSLGGATPVWLIGRLVASASWTARRNAANSEVVLGGDNGLRGYPSGAFSKLGGSAIQATVEARTLPLVIASVHLGGVLFYDTGSVYTRLNEAEFHHGAGMGLRVLFPQFNYDPFRLDFGVPLGEDGFTVLLSYSSSQAI